MIDPSTLRDRAAETDPTRRKRSGVAVVATLRALVDRVGELLPPLAALERFASPSTASELFAGWRCPGGGRSEAARLVVIADPAALRITYGYGPSAGDAPLRRQRIAREQRRRRELGEALSDRLSALRGMGATLQSAGRDGLILPDDEWIRAAAATVAFELPWASLAPRESANRRVALRVAALACLGSALGVFSLDVPAGGPVSLRGFIAAARSLRWDERAEGDGAPPAGMVPSGRFFFYDPATGWFVPERFAARSPPSVAMQRLAVELDPLGPAVPTTGASAEVSQGLHARLSRWLRARGVVRAEAMASSAEVRVLADRCPGADEIPALEALVGRVHDDPSGDSAVALAALLLGAPWTLADPLDPRAVAGRVPPRIAERAASGHARLRAQGLLTLGRTGGLDEVGECLADPAVRPVLWLAVERVLGTLEPFGAVAREERSSARAWELPAASMRSANLERVARRLQTHSLAAGMAFPLDLLRAVLVGLRCKPFAIFTGAPGTGKTGLALALARFMTEGLPERAGAQRIAVVPVRPDWIDSRGLLGYLNPLQGRGAYEDSSALRVMLDAAQNPSDAHFLILDEMNLARAEHYLAEVLSAIESGAPIPLHGRPEGVATMDGARVVPSELPFPTNLFVLGTVNLDETAHTFSPKVLDRAFTWEFPVSAPSTLLAALHRERRVVSPADESERAALLGSGDVEDPVRALVLTLAKDGVGKRIDRLFEALSSHGRPFGHRVASEMLRFVYLAEREGLEVPPWWALDRAVLGKILPRLGGTRRELDSVLRDLLAVCATDAWSTRRRPRPERGLADGRSDPAEGDIDLAASAAKIKELRSRLDAEAFVTFSR